MKWRLIEDGAHTGAQNMARDVALLESLQFGALPTLRFYDWQPSCLSLGRFQRVPEAVQVLAQRGDASIVRRPTGGRAVWHQHEITYGAVFPLDILPNDERGVTASYRWLSAGFLRGLQTLGIAAQLSAGHKAAAKSSGENCFVAAAQCDTIVDGRKIIGAAQCRVTLGERVFVLQHGSILLDVDWPSWQRMLGTEAEAMRGSIVTLRELGFSGSTSKLKAAIAAGLSEVLGARWESGIFSESEENRSRALEAARYGTVRWNCEGKSDDKCGK